MIISATIHRCICGDARRSSHIRGSSDSGEKTTLPSALLIVGRHRLGTLLVRYHVVPNEIDRGQDHLAIGVNGTVVGPARAGSHDVHIHCLRQCYERASDLPAGHLADR